MDQAGGVGEAQSCDYKFNNPGFFAQAPIKKEQQSDEAAAKLAGKIEQLEHQLRTLTERLTPLTPLTPSTPFGMTASPDSPRLSTESKTADSLDVSSCPSTRVGSLSTISVSSTNSTNSSDDDRKPSLPFFCGNKTLPRRFSTSQAEYRFSLWQRYAMTVDPLLKVVDPRMIQHLFLSPVSILRQYTADAMAIKYAVCFAAVASMQKTPGSPSSDAMESSLKDYSFQIECALARSDINTRPTLVTLQAFCIYLISGRSFLAKDYVWSLTALLVRLAFKLKLHRDPDQQGFTFKECEWRRRLWWNIYFLDARVAEENDTDPLIFECHCTTRFPSAVQDHSIRGSQPRSSLKTHATDTFCALVRFETTYYARTILFSDAFTEANGYPVLSCGAKLSVVDSLERMLKEKYLRHCDCQSSTCVLAANCAKAIVATLKLKLWRARRLTSLQRNHINSFLCAAVDILDTTRALRTEPDLNPWSWLIDDDAEWDAAYICLSTLATFEEQCETLNRAWKAANHFFDTWRDNIESHTQQDRWNKLQALKREALGERIGSPLFDAFPTNADRRQTISSLSRSDAIKGESLSRRSVDGLKRRSAEALNKRSVSEGQWMARNNRASRSTTTLVTTGAKAAQVFESSEGKACNFFALRCMI